MPRKNHLAYEVEQTGSTLESVRIELRNLREQFSRLEAQLEIVAHRLVKLTAVKTESANPITSPHDS